ncbi:MAG: DUF2851 family protein [Edaphocola sp.]
MNEALFQYLWQNSLYRPEGISTTSGEPVTVIHPGTINRHAGPDFTNARIKVGDTTWAGNVELHIKASDWHKHKHTADPRYQNIVLHVIYEDDLPMHEPSFPTIILKNHLDQTVVERYRLLVGHATPIACANQLGKISDIIWSSWLERLLAERWEHRLAEWQLLWLQAGKDWRTLLYYRLAANFGFHVNRDAFLSLALSLPLNILVKHRKSLLQTEALLFGQAGLLQPAQRDDYVEKLETEYQFLRRKYQLTPMVPHRWKFLRLRPQNFPTIRIAQFAMIVHKSLELFARLMEVKNAKDLMPLLDVHAGDYWHNHYRFGETVLESNTKHLGKDAVNNILINTVAPMQYLYAQLQGKTHLHESSVALLSTLKPEDNNIVRTWKAIGIKPKDAAQTQALLQLFNEYCTPRKCLQCTIGNRLVRKG